MRSVIVFATLAATALAGCGGSTSTRTVTATAATATAPTATPQTTATTAVVSHQAFIEELNGICREGNSKIAAAGKSAASGGQTPTAAADLADAGVKIYDEVLPLLRALDAPAGDSQALAKYIRTVDRSRGIATRIADAERSGADVTVLLTAGKKEKQARLNAALDLGANDCGGQ